MSRRKEPTIPNALLDQLLAGGTASAAFEQGGLLESLKKALTERALNAEMDHHLAGDDGAGNTRNGYGRKTVMTDTGKLAIDVPRDCQASFDPQLIAKYQRRFPGFDEKIVSMYARGMSTCEITGHLHDLYGIDVSPDLISTVTDAVLDERSSPGSSGRWIRSMAAERHHHGLFLDRQRRGPGFLGAGPQIGRRRPLAPLDGSSSG